MKVLSLLTLLALTACTPRVEAQTTGFPEATRYPETVSIWIDPIYRCEYIMDWRGGITPRMYMVPGTGQITQRGCLVT